MVICGRAVKSFKAAYCKRYHVTLHELVIQDGIFFIGCVLSPSGLMTALAQMQGAGRERAPDKFDNSTIFAGISNKCSNICSNIQRLGKITHPLLAALPGALASAHMNSYCSTQ